MIPFINIKLIKWKKNYEILVLKLLIKIIIQTIYKLAESKRTTLIGEIQNFR